MNASAPIDDWQPAWRTFDELLQDDSIGAGGSASFLTELDQVAKTRRSWTREEWRHLVASTASGLAARGVRPGESVAVLAGNEAEALAVAFACWASGYVYLPLNAHESDDRLRFIIDDAAAALVVHASALRERALRLAGAARPAIPGADLTGPGERPVAADLEGAALRVYTSGTTGKPKGVRLTMRNLVTDCDALRLVTGWDATTRAMVVLPIHHVNGLVVSSLQAWTVGASIVLCDRFRSDTFWADIETEQVTVSSMVPTLLEFLLAQERRTVPAGLREVFCGAGPLMTETVLMFEAEFGVPVRHLYGLSETTAVATMMPRLADADRHGWYAGHGFPSIGPAVEHVEVDIWTPDGNLCGAGDRGEIVVRGATVMSGYAQREGETAVAFEGGWFHTGDEGFWLPGPAERRYFFVTGRLKELIIRGGVNISPFVVDEVLNSHPAVQFGVTVPFENRYYGEEIAAYIVPAMDVTDREILEFCAERLDFAYCPKVVIFGTDVPYTATGKAKRLQLKDQLADELASYRDTQFRRSGQDDRSR